MFLKKLATDANSRFIDNEEEPREAEFAPSRNALTLPSSPLLSSSSSSTMTPSPKRPKKGKRGESPQTLPHPRKQKQSAPLKTIPRNRTVHDKGILPSFPLPPPNLNTTDGKLVAATSQPMRSPFGDCDVSPAVLAAALGVPTEPLSAASTAAGKEDLDSLKRHIVSLEKTIYLLREQVGSVRYEQRTQSALTDGMIMRWRRRVEELPKPARKPDGSGSPGVGDHVLAELGSAFEQLEEEWKERRSEILESLLRPTCAFCALSCPCCAMAPGH